jgi:hypothetical protein
MKWRALAIGLLIWSAILIASAISDEFDGTVTINGSRSLPQTYTRQTSPERFRDAMNYSWLLSLLPGLAGIILLSILHKQDSVDPFSPKFKGGRDPDS